MFGVFFFVFGYVVLMAWEAAHGAAGLLPLCLSKPVPSHPERKGTPPRDSDEIKRTALKLALRLAMKLGCNEGFVTSWSARCLSVKLSRWQPEEGRSCKTGKPFKNVRGWRRKDESSTLCFSNHSCIFEESQWCGDVQVRLGFSAQFGADVRSAGKRSNLRRPSPSPAFSHRLEIISLIVCREVCWFRGERFSCVLCFMFSELSVFRSQLCDVPSLDDSHRKRRCGGVRTPDQPHGERRLGGEHDWTAGQNHPYWSSECVTPSLSICIFFLPQAALHWMLNGY